MNEMREHERNHYYELVLSAVEDVKPKTYVVINCNTCGEPIKCQIKIVDRTRNSVQCASVDVDQRDLDLHHMSPGHVGEIRVDKV